LSAGLQYAHDERIVHRDLKPENILLGRNNEALLSDFGIALMTQSSRYQSTQDVIGTVPYMAPEQIQGKPRPASDQYSLGIVVYEWLAGDRPFHGTFTELCAQHMFVPPRPLRERAPTVSTEVEQVVMTALAKDPYRRFGSVQAFANALEQASQSKSVTPQLSSSPSATQLAVASSPSATSPTTNGTSSAEPGPPVEPPDEKRMTDDGHEAKVNVWGIGKRRIVAAILGLFLYALLTYCVNSLIINNSIFDGKNEVVFTYARGGFGAISLGTALVGAAFLIPIFFGAAFGPWVGLFTGVVGSFLGNYFTRVVFGIYGTYYILDAYSFHKYLLSYYGQIYDPFGLAWRWYIGIALLSFIAGLALFRAKGDYTDAHTLSLANIIAAIGAGVGIGFITVSGITAGLDGRAILGQFLSLALPTIIFLLVFLPRLLWGFRVTVERVISRILRSSTQQPT